MKCTLYTTAMHISLCSFMYLFFSLYCDACLKTSTLRVGVKTIHNTIQLFNHNLTFSNMFELYA